MSTFREFQAGFEVGEAQKKRAADARARASASAMAASGNYEKAESELMGAGLFDEASALGGMGDRHRVRTRERTYGEAFRTGGYAGVRDAAGAEGDVGMAAQLDQVIATMGDRERQDAALRAQFLGNAAYGLSQVAPEERQAALMEMVETSGEAFGITPEQAMAFDLSDENLQLTYENALSVADRIMMQRDDERYAEEKGWREQVYKDEKDFRERTLGMQGRQLRIAEETWAAQKKALENPPVDFKDESQLRNEYMKHAGTEFAGVRQAYTRLNAADATPAGDLALIYGLMKMIDPNAAVMEGDVANASNTSGVPAQILNLYNSVVGGEKLTAAQRQQFKAQGARLYQAAEEPYGMMLDIYRSIADEAGFDPERAAPDLRIMDFGDLDTFIGAGGGNTNMEELDAILGSGGPTFSGGN